MEKAERELITEHLHDWRKQAKYLWHQFQVLTPIAPGELGELADQFHRLSDYRGDEHDLAVLEQVLSKLNYSRVHGGSRVSRQGPRALSQSAARQGVYIGNTPVHSKVTSVRRACL
jgi:CHAD domain-containing protein